MSDISEEYLRIVKTLKSYLKSEWLSGITEILVAERRRGGEQIAGGIRGTGKVNNGAGTGQTISSQAARGKKVLSPVTQQDVLHPKTDEPATKGNLAIKEGPSEKMEKMKQLYSLVSRCTKCALYKTRTNLVFGSGNINARLCFVGEAPGYDEDQQGKPFVGQAGRKLTDIIEAMTLTRKDVFIANILKCRPPSNRNPQPDEIRACWPHLKEQLEIIQPEVICTLGKFAAWTLLDLETPISELRGKFHEWQGIKVMPTYHPAYLLRNPGAKKLVWEDVQKIMAVLGLKIPKSEKKDKR